MISCRGKSSVTAKPRKRPEFSRNSDEYCLRAFRRRNFRADALKLWVAFQRYGIRTLAAIYDRLCDLAQSMCQQLEEHPEFEPMHAPESNILCFRWIGSGDFGDEALDAFNRELRESYNRSGEGWITATNLNGRRVLRVTIMNPRTTEADLAEIIAGLARQAEVMRAAN